MCSQATFDRSQGRNSSGKGRNRKRAAYKLPMACSSNVLIEPRITCLGVALPTLPTSTVSQENVPQDMPTDKSDEGNPSVEVPSSQGTLIWASLTKVTCTIILVCTWVVCSTSLIGSCVCRTLESDCLHSFCPLLLQCKWAGFLLVSHSAFWVSSAYITQTHYIYSSSHNGPSTSFYQ